MRFLRSIGCLSTACLLAGPLQAAPSAADAARMLQDGNARFIANASTHPNTSLDHVASTGSHGQTPFVTVLGCSDSRVPLERLFDQGIGDIFVVRVAGNVADGDEIGSVEYGMAHLGTPLLVVLGHTKCGAVTAVANGEMVHGSIPGLVDNIAPAVAAVRQKHPTASGEQLVSLAVRQNVLTSIQDILTGSEEVRGLVLAGKAQVVGAVYDIETGSVAWLGQHPEQARLLTTPAAAAGKGHAAKGRTASHDAALTPVKSSGAFVAPSLSIASRPSFGAAAGKATEIQVGEEHHDKTHTMVWVLAGAALLTVGVAGLMAFRMCRVQTADGRPGWALTMGGKLVAGFGLLTASILGLSAFGTKAVVDLTNIAIEEGRLAGQTALVTALEGDANALYAAILGFINDPTDASLGNYSDLTATMHRRMEHAKDAIHDEALLSQLGVISQEMDQIDQLFREAVTQTDKLAGVIDSQMGPSAEHAAKLLVEAEHAAVAAGETDTALGIAQTAVKFESARTTVFRYFRNRNEAMAEDALHRAEEAIHEVDAVASASDVGGATAALNEAHRAIKFWEERLEEAVKMTAARHELVTEDVYHAEHELLNAAEEVVSALATKFAELEAVSEQRSASTAFLLLVVSVVATVLAGTIALILTRDTIRPIRALMTLCETVAKGDLTPRMTVRKQDEFGQLGTSFNTLLGNMHSAISSVSGATVEVAAAATEIAASAEEMARSIDEQTRQISQVSAAVTEMSASIGEVAGKASQTASEANDSGRAALEGGQVVLKAVDDMNEIDTTVTESARVVTELGRKSEKISEIISVINDIADQTNLLALNAAIEAARAGEHGRGFAVVADEVRKLAERTTGATKEVADSINGIRTETETAVQQIAMGTTRVKQGVERANAAGAKMQDIESKSAVVARLVGEIAAASEEQAAATEQISRSVESVNTATSEASCGANQAAVAASQLSSKSEELRTLVERFKI